MIIRLVVIILFILVNIYPSYANEYPFGIYGTWSVKDDNKAFSIVSEKGFNLVEVPPNKTVLDLCSKYKIKALVSFNLSKETSSNKTSLNNFQENMINKARELKDHPALFGWYIVDEPNLKGIPPNVVSYLYKKLKSIEKGKPVYIYLAYPGTWDNYLDTADIIGISGYLRKGEKAKIIRERILKIRSDLSKEGLSKIVWLVLHAFDYRFKDRQSPYKSISGDEFKETWKIALDEGITGLMVYTLGSLPRAVPIEPYYLPKDRPDLWIEIDMIRDEIKKIKIYNEKN